MRTPVTAPPTSPPPPAAAAAAARRRRARGAYEGVRQILVYNWPFYVVSLGVIVAAGAVALAFPLPAWVRAPLFAGLFVALFWTIGSVAASYYVYDYSKLMRWEWVGELFAGRPAVRSWVNLHAGLNEVGAWLPDLFPGARGVTLDFYDAREMSEPSIKRARDAAGEGGGEADAPSVVVRSDALPLADGGFDLALLVFAAHELRRAAARAKLFAELRRALRDGGRVLVVEHLRDWANFAVYGPGFLHFLPRRAWLAAAAGGEFAVAREMKITPFVRVFVFEKAPR